GPEVGFWHPGANPLRGRHADRNRRAADEHSGRTSPRNTRPQFAGLWPCRDRRAGAVHGTHRVSRARRGQGVAGNRSCRRGAERQMTMSAQNKRDPKIFLGELARLESIIERFEKAWEQGQTPALEEYLHAPDVEPHKLMVELAHVDLECR